jgi:outer membrane lipoprotein LolB
VNALVRLVVSALLIALLFIAGCANAPLTSAPYGAENQAWRGRLALRIDSREPQSFSASFDLIGHAKAGKLILYGPLGSTGAHLVWTLQSATLSSNGSVRQFSSLEELATQATGTALPIAALFDWLAGRDVAVAGWEADLSQLAQGRLTARRLQPEPTAELRLILEP